ncbi:MAG TPA: hypothetical protein VK391_06465, partial [Allosphingosinicella sp.]|nr:hypothetical protein [Allosphingosinicella sp.]
MVALSEQFRYALQYCLIVLINLNRVYDRVPRLFLAGEGAKITRSGTVEVEPHNCLPVVVVEENRAIGL